MKIFFILLFVIAVLFIAVYFYFSKSYPTGYFIQNDKVVFGEWMAGDYKVHTTELNPQTWQDLGNDYAKDDQRVLFNARQIKDVDIESFERIKVNPAEVQDYYSRDKNHLYAGSGVVKNIDPKTVVLMPGSYVKDQRGVYYKHTLIEGADAATAKVLHKGYIFVLVDKSSVYHLGEMIKDADPQTFEILNYSGNDDHQPQFKDKNYKYSAAGKRL